MKLRQELARNQIEAKFFSRANNIDAKKNLSNQKQQAHKLLVLHLNLLANLVECKALMGAHIAKKEKYLSSLTNSVSNNNVHSLMSMRNRTLNRINELKQLLLQFSSEIMAIIDPLCLKQTDEDEREVFEDAIFCLADFCYKLNKGINFDGVFHCKLMSNLHNIVIRINSIEFCNKFSEFSRLITNFQKLNSEYNQIQNALPMRKEYERKMLMHETYKTQFDTIFNELRRNIKTMKSVDDIALIKQNLENFYEWTSNKNLKIMLKRSINLTQTVLNDNPESDSLKENQNLENIPSSSTLS